MQNRQDLKIYNEIFKILLILFTAWFLIIGINILPQHFIGDDLHLIRKYTFDELLNSWSDDWDPDDLETLAYRPIAILFYNFQTFLFGENYYLHNLFSILLLFILMNVIIIFLIYLKFPKFQILIFLSIFIFSKSFSTLPSWKVLSALIFCYICFFLVGIFFLKWLRSKEIKYLFYIFLFTFLSIFSREETYHLPFFLIIIFLFDQENKKINFYLLREPLILTVIIVTFHYFLRLNFVPEAAQPEINLSSLLNFLKAGLASGLPGGIKTYEIHEKILQLVWIFSLLLLTSIVIKKGITKIEIKKIILIFFTVCLLTSPMSVKVRDFGIFLPTVFTTLFIAFFISKLFPLKIKNYYLSNRLNLCVLIILLSSGIISGTLRSIEHINIWSYNSIYNLSSDSNWIFGERFRNASIPLSRKNFKINELKKFGITEVISYDQLKEKVENDKEKNLSNVIITNHFPLQF